MGLLATMDEYEWNKKQFHRCDMENYDTPHDMFMSEVWKGIYNEKYIVYTIKCLPETYLLLKKR